MLANVVAQEFAQIDQMRSSCGRSWPNSAKTWHKTASGRRGADSRLSRHLFDKCWALVRNIWTTSGLAGIAIRACGEQLFRNIRVGLSLTQPARPGTPSSERTTRDPPENTSSELGLGPCSVCSALVVPAKSILEVSARQDLLDLQCKLMLPVFGHRSCQICLNLFLNPPASWASRAGLTYGAPEHF